jgi:hypothetical protein
VTTVSRSVNLGGPGNLIQSGSLMISIAG